VGRGKEENEEKEQRPEDGECISRVRTCVGTCGAAGGKKKRDLFRTTEKKRIKAEIERNTLWRKREKREREEGGREREREREREKKEREEFILAAMMVAVSESAISEQLPPSCTESIYFFTS